MNRRYAGAPRFLKHGRIDRFVLGSYERTDVDVDVIDGDIEEIVRQVGTPFDVILGWAFLSQFAMVLDYNRLVVEFGQGTMNLAQPRIGVTYSVINGVPVVPVTVDKQDRRFLFDTGAPSCSIDTALAATPEGTRVTKAITLGNARLTAACRVKDLSVIKQSLGCTGVIANDLLSGHKVFFDVGRHMIYRD